MNRAFGYAAGAAFAIAGAYFTRASGGLPFWLFVIGAGGFLLAAAGQFFNAQK
jgi:hypothetical protein